MQKVINGLLYDTDTAQRLVTIDKGTIQGEAFRHKHEVHLCRTPNGRYFLHKVWRQVGLLGTLGSPEDEIVLLSTPADVQNWCIAEQKSFLEADIPPPQAA
jgi:hypothetical protein